MKKPRILIVEDEILTRHHLERALDRLGYEVAGVARNGASAIEQLDRSLPDLIIADIGLEGDIDGVAVAAHAREAHGIPTVFLTAYSDPETIRRARLSNPYGFLVKPFAIQELQKTIETGLRHDGERNGASTRTDG